MGVTSLMLTVIKLTPYASPARLGLSYASLLYAVYSHRRYSNNSDYDVSQRRIFDPCILLFSPTRDWSSTLCVQFPHNDTQTKGWQCQGHIIICIIMKYEVMIITSVASFLFPLRLRGEFELPTHLIIFWYNMFLLVQFQVILDTN